MQYAESVVVSACGQQSACTFDQIARPDEVVATQIFVALIEAPGNGEAGDDSTEEVFGFVRAHDRYTGAVQIFFTRFGVEFLQGSLPSLPVMHVIVAGGFVSGEQGRDDLLTGFGPDSAQA